MESIEATKTLKEYYDRRAAEYDDAYTGRGRWPFTQALGLESEIPLLKDFVAELVDGSKYVIYKKYFRPEELVDELRGGRIVLSTSWFVAVEREW